MNGRMCFGREVLAAATIALATGSGRADDTAAFGFTVQGRLVQDQVAVSAPGGLDFEFTLWDAETGGAQIGPSRSCPGLPVESGLFSASIDFGPVTDGGPRWLQIRVDLDPTAGFDFVTLPRRPLGRAAQADYAEFAAGAGNGAASVDAVNGFVFDDDLALPGDGVLRGLGRLHLQSQVGEPLYLNALSENGGDVEVGFGPIQPRLVTWGVLEAKQAASLAGPVGIGGETVSGAILEVTGSTMMRGAVQVEAPTASMQSPGLLVSGAGPTALELRHFVPGVTTVGWLFEVLAEQSEYPRDLIVRHRQSDDDVAMRLTEDGAGFFNGVVTAPGFSGAPSDARLKEAIRPLEYGLDAILGLEPVSYRWRPGTRQQRALGTGDELGFLAQRVRAVVPELVRQGDDGMLRVQYDRLTPVLVRALQEQQTVIDELITRNTELEAAVAELATRLARLETMFVERNGKENRR